MFEYDKRNMILPVSNKIHYTQGIHMLNRQDILPLRPLEQPNSAEAVGSAHK